MPTIEKAIELLGFFSSRQSEIGLSEFQKLSGFNKGTVYRYLTALKNCGFLEQTERTKAYRLGPALIRLAAVREKALPLLDIVTPYVDAIARESRELVHVSLPQPQGMSSVYAKDGGISGTRVGFDEADLLPYHATSSGLVMLSFGSAELSRQVMQGRLCEYTNKTSVTAESVSLQVDLARELGFVRNNQSYEIDVCSVAIPFFGSSSADAMGAIAIATPFARMTEGNQQVFVRLLIRASIQLSTDLGGLVPAHILAIWNEF